MKRFSVKLILLLFFYTLVTVESGAHAGTAPRQVIVLTIATKPEQTLLEQQLITQLKLELDSFSIGQKNMRDTGFTEAQFQDRLKIISRLDFPQDAMGVLWIEALEPDTTYLHVVALDTGKAYVRSIEAGQSAHVAEDLAFSVQEVLWQINIKNPSAITSRTQQEEKKEESVSPLLTPDPVAFSIGCFAILQGANPSKWMQIGGGALLELRFFDHLSASISFTAAGLLPRQPDDGKVASTALLPELTIGTIWRSGRVRFGLIAGVQPGYYRLKLEMTEGEKKEFHYLDTLLFGGMDFRIPLTKAMSLLLAPGAGFRLHTRDIKRESDNSTIISTPLLNWRLITGVQIDF